MGYTARLVGKSGVAVVVVVVGGGGGSGQRLGSGTAAIVGRPAQSGQSTWCGSLGSIFNTCQMKGLCE